MSENVADSSNNLYNLKHQKLSTLIWNYATPAIIGTTVNALYNIIDRLFIANANLTGLVEEVGVKSGQQGLAAIGFLLPVMTIVTAFGMLIGIGSASRISLNLGKGDKDVAERIIGNALLLSITISICVSTVLYVFTDWILEQLGAREAGEDVFLYAKQFMSVFVPGAMFSTLCFSFNNMMRASGYPKKAMYTMILTMIINIILAPIFIYVLGWGMHGAALATVLAMIIGSGFVLYHFISGKNNLKLRAKYIRFNWTIEKKILSIGMSPFLVTLVSSLIMFSINKQFLSYGSALNVKAYTIVNVLVVLMIMVMTGLTQGMQPIVGYNYGAGNIKRVQETVYYVVKVGIVIGVLGFIIGHLLPFLIIKPFHAPFDLAQEAQRGLEYVTFSAPLIGFQIVTSSFFQCIGMVKQSILLTLTRQLIFFIPALYILPRFWGLTGIWLAFPASDIAATVITGAVFVWQMKKFNQLIEKNNSTVI